MRAKSLTAMVVVLVLTPVLLLYLYLRHPNVEMTYEILSVHGDVNIDGQPIQTGSDTRLKAAGTRISTGADGLISLRLEDGSIVQLLPRSDMRMQQAKRNRLYTRFDTHLLLNKGEMLRKLPEGDNQQRNADLTTGSANIGVRGTEFRVTADREGTSVTVVRGKVAVGDTQGNQQELTENYGLRVDRQSGLQEAAVLLPPPELLQPLPSQRIETQQLLLEWVPTARASEYLLEISADSAFNALLFQLRTPLPQHAVTLPMDAPLFWRVSSIDEQNLPGRPSESRIVHYRPHYQAISDAGATITNAQQALRHIPAALHGYPTDAEVHRTAAWLYYLNGAFEQALQHYDQALQIVPMDAEALIERARTHYWLGNLQQSETDYRKVLDFAPEDADALWGLADTLREQHHYEDAIQLAQASLRHRQNNLDARLVLARALISAGQETQAKPHLQFILARQPEHQQALGLIKLLQVQDAQTP